MANVKVRLKDASNNVLHPETDWSVVQNKPTIVSKKLSLTLLEPIEGGLNSNINGVHAEVSGIAALPHESYPASRIIYSPRAEFQKDGDTILSPIGWESYGGRGVVLTGASPASKLCPAALPFLGDAFDNYDETFKSEAVTGGYCEFRIHPLVLKLRLGNEPEFEGQLIAWVYGYQPREEEDRNSPISLATIMENCIGTTVIQSYGNQSSLWSTVFNVLILKNGSCSVSYYTGTSNMIKASKTYSANQVTAYQYYPFRWAL